MLALIRGGEILDLSPFISIKSWTILHYELDIYESVLFCVFRRSQGRLTGSQGWFL